MKKLGYLALALLLLLGLTGCGQEPPDGGEALPQVSGEGRQEDTVVSEDFGSYRVPAGWVAMEPSTPGKVFYVEEGSQEEEFPDNISVNLGTNPYPAQEHETFRQAIQAQLVRQIAPYPETQLTGEGSTTQQGDILYRFTITEPETTTQQYYIVGEKRFCLIHLTLFSGSQEAEDAARQMADSFQWAEEPTD